MFAMILWARGSQAQLRCRRADGEPLLCWGSCSHTAVGMGWHRRGCSGGVGRGRSYRMPRASSQTGARPWSPAPGEGEKGLWDAPCVDVQGEVRWVLWREGWWAPGMGWGSHDRPSLGECEDPGGRRVVAADLPDQEPEVKCGYHQCIGISNSGFF